MQQEVSFVDLIATLKTIKPEKSEELERLQSKYSSGSLLAAGAFTLTKMSVGLETCKQAFEKLAPGYSRDWASADHEHPPIV